MPRYYTPEAPESHLPLAIQWLGDSGKQAGKGRDPGLEIPGKGKEIPTEELVYEDPTDVIGVRDRAKLLNR